MRNEPASAVVRLILFDSYGGAGAVLPATNLPMMIDAFAVSFARRCGCFGASSGVVLSDFLEIRRHPVTEQDAKSVIGLGNRFNTTLIHVTIAYALGWYLISRR